MTTKVSICIATYKRPHGLKRLMEGINHLRFNKFTLPDIEVVVVDNDASGSAQYLCDCIKTNFRWSLKYDIEPIQGVSFARNRAIKNSAEESNFIVMIDDDEVPRSSWLEELLLTQSEYGADIVTGPVFPYFEEQNLPQWIRNGNFFVPRLHQTGTLIGTAFTNNVLVRADILKQLNGIFDERFAIKGAEDTHLFMRLHSKGYKIVWASEAIVDEWIPASRTNLKWILQRGYWGWSSYSFIEKEIYSSSKYWLIRFFKGAALIGLGLVSFFPAMIQSKHKLVSALLSSYRGLGTISGLFGLQGQWK